jgi:hypothetical protein
VSPLTFSISRSAFFYRPLAAHALSAILLGIALAGLYVHISHRRARRNLLLTTPPGSIASTVALTSRSGFGELLLPYDDEATIRRKLAGLRFHLDPRTGAILADDAVEYDSYAQVVPDETMMSLLDPRRHNSFHAYPLRDSQLISNIAPRSATHMDVSG